MPRRIAAKLAILTLCACAAPLWPAAAQDGGVVVLQAGYEEHQVTVVDQSTREVALQNGDSPNFSTNSKAVFSILGPVLVPEFTCVAGYVKEFEFCILGFGFRFSGGQKRLEGDWFPLLIAPGEAVRFRYDATQFSFEVLFGLGIGVRIPFLAVGYRAGVNNYDLLVAQGNTILIDQANRYSEFRSTSLYFNPGAYIPLSIFDFAALSLELSLEETVKGDNVVRVSNINTGAPQRVDLHTKTSRISLQFLYFF